MAHSMQDITGIESQDIMINTIIQCLNNNSTIEPESLETLEDIGANNDFDKIFDYNKVSNNNMSVFYEFDEVLSKYIKERDFDRNTQLNTTKEASSTESLLEISIDIAESSNKAKNFQGTYEEYLKNNANNCDDANSFQDIKTESLDVICDDDSLELLEGDHSVDLGDISLASNNIFTNLANPNEHKSIEIEIDVKVADSQNLHNMTSVARNYPEKFTYNSNYDRNNFENESIQNMDTNDVDNNSECSYHSSDFELITEEEAKMDGLILHFRRNDDVKEIFRSNNESFIEMYLPDENSYRENHKIPEGEEFYNLFRGVYAPVMMPDIFLENKSVIPTQCMSVEKEAMGFDLRFLDKDTNIVDEEHQEEAKETAKKILETYGSQRRHSRRLS